MVIVLTAGVGAFITTLLTIAVVDQIRPPSLSNVWKSHVAQPPLAHPASHPAPPACHR
jgi:hypothetical protein